MRVSPWAEAPCTGIIGRVMSLDCGWPFLRGGRLLLLWRSAWGRVCSSRQRPSTCLRIQAAAAVASPIQQGSAYPEVAVEMPTPHRDGVRVPLASPIPPASAYRVAVERPMPTGHQIPAPAPLVSCIPPGCACRGADAQMAADQLPGRYARLSWSATQSLSSSSFSRPTASRAQRRRRSRLPSAAGVARAWRKACSPRRNWSRLRW